MTRSNQDNQKPTSQRILLTFSGLAGIAAFLAIFYYSGLYTEFRGEMQRLMLWTGLYDAGKENITKIDGPNLSESDYNVSLSKSGGGEVKLKELKGKVLFVNLWASWCIPCAAEMPTIESLYKSVAENKDIKLLLISVDNEQERAVEFMQDENYTMPYYFPQSDLPQPLQGFSIPTTYVISKEGQIVYKKEGMADYSTDSFKKWILKLADS